MICSVLCRKRLNGTCILSAKGRASNESYGGIFYLIVLGYLIRIGAGAEDTENTCPEIGISSSQIITRHVASVDKFGKKN